MRTITASITHSSCLDFSSDSGKHQHPMLKLPPSHPAQAKAGADAVGGVAKWVFDTVQRIFQGLIGAVDDELDSAFQVRVRNVFLFVSLMPASRW